VHAACGVGVAALDHLSDVFSNLRMANVTPEQYAIGRKVVDVSIQISGIQAACITGD
jgi:hypothetical protein